MNSNKKTKRFGAVIASIAMLLTVLLSTSALAAYLGDVDGNGKVQATDARRILRHAAKIELIADEAGLKLSDVDGDGKIKAGDARLALRMASKMDPLVEVSAEEQTTEEPTTEAPTTEAPAKDEPGSVYFTVTEESERLAGGVFFYGKGELANTYLKPELSVLFAIFPLPLSQSSTLDIVDLYNAHRETFHFAEVYNISEDDYEALDTMTGTQYLYNFSVSYNDIRLGYYPDAYAYVVPCTVDLDGTVKRIESIRVPNPEKEIVVPYIQIPDEADVSVDTDDEEQLMRIAARFSKGVMYTDNLIAADAEMTISLVCSDGTEMYNKTITISKEDFKKQNYSKYLEQLCAVITIPYSEMEKGRKSSGELNIEFKFANDETMTIETKKIDHLPYISVADLCSLTLPTLPASYSEYGYNDKIISTFRIDAVEYEFKTSYDEKTAYLELKITGEKLYDSEGDHQSRECKIGYKIYDAEDYIYKSGGFSIDSMAMGEKVRGFTETIYGDFVPGEYRIEFLNVN